MTGIYLIETEIYVQCYVMKFFESLIDIECLSPLQQCCTIKTKLVSAHVWSLQTFMHIGPKSYVSLVCVGQCSVLYYKLRRHYHHLLWDQNVTAVLSGDG